MLPAVCRTSPSLHPVAAGHTALSAPVARSQAIYRTYYKQPPSEREVRAFADTVFLDDGGTLRPHLPLSVFLEVMPIPPSPLPNTACPSLIWHAPP
eukprot:2341054-Prymnesium_polylepis.1